MTKENRRWGIATIALVAAAGIAATAIHFGSRPGADPEYRSMAVAAYDAMYRADKDIDDDEFGIFERDLAVADAAARRLEGRATEAQKSTGSYRAIIKGLNAFQKIDEIQAGAYGEKITAAANQIAGIGGAPHQSEASLAERENKKRLAIREAAGLASTEVQKAKAALDAKD